MINASKVINKIEVKILTLDKVQNNLILCDISTFGRDSLRIYTV